jgi:expansin (peptidoglycan-binding protein)
MRRATLLLLAAAVSCGGIRDDEGGAAGTAPPLGEVQQGIATYYPSADGDGACMFGPSPNDLDVAAMNAEQWGGSAACGVCARVEGPKGTVVVRIVDLCPECKKGHLDLSPQAFGKIAEIAQGRVQVSWQLQACDVAGNVRYHTKDGSSQWWTAIQVRNHRIPIRSLAYQKDGAWVDVEREGYNYFVEPAGMGAGPIRLRVTAWDGQTLEDQIAGPDGEATYVGQAQFQ